MVIFFHCFPVFFNSTKLNFQKSFPEKDLYENGHPFVEKLLQDV